jgi:hypothetical protein
LSRDVIWLDNTKSVVIVDQLEKYEKEKEYDTNENKKKKIKSLRNQLNLKIKNLHVEWK